MCQLIILFILTPPYLVVGDDVPLRTNTFFPSRSEEVTRAVGRWCSFGRSEEEKDSLPFADAAEIVICSVISELPS